MSETITVFGVLRDITGTKVLDDAPITVSVHASPTVDPVTGEPYAVDAEAIYSQHPVVRTDEDGRWEVTVVKATGVVHRIESRGWMPTVYLDDDLHDDGAVVDARTLIDVPGGATPVEWVTLTSVIASIDGKVATATAAAVPGAVADYLAAHPPAGGGVTDHGALTGLGDDDHSAVYVRFTIGASGPAVPRAGDFWMVTP